MPVLSVIIPVYNAEKSLKCSVESVLNQTFRELELILVDDGSTDNSLEICKRFEKSDDRVKVIHKENGGAGPARNAGIAIARGKYLAFPDSDDYLELDTYEICLNKLAENDADLLVFGIKTNVFDDEKDTVLETREENIPQIYYEAKDDCRENYVNLHKSMNMNSPCNKVYKSEVIRNNALRFPDLRRMQDGVFNMLYFDKISSFCSISDNLFIRTWHSNKTENQKLPESVLQCLITYHKTALSFLDKWQINTAQNRLFFDSHFLETINNLEFVFVSRSDFAFLYHHIKSINNDRYVHSFLAGFKAGGNHLRKKELLMLRRCNIVLALLRRFNK